jgi:Ni,Fe-hydrogenase III large subunit
MVFGFYVVSVALLDAKVRLFVRHRGITAIFVKIWCRVAKLSRVIYCYIPIHSVASFVTAEQFLEA